jgi:chemotaxis regulatin CheY-phosphate phosphatase CheZ
LSAFLLATVLLAGGCGGDSAGSSEEWAGSVCTSLSEWVEDVDASLKSLGEQGLQLDAEDVRETVVEVGDATDELANDLRELGLPETEWAPRAEEELEMLREELRAQADRIERAAETGRDPLEFAATVAAALAVAANELEETFRDLQELDPGGELEDGFRDADSCDELREQVEDID